jgi:hypothetical protein
VIAEAAHSGWAQADCSAGLLAGCLIQADCLAGVLPDGSIPDGHSAALLADGPADCLVEQSADASIPPGRRERCSLDARLAHWPMAQLRHDWLEGYKALPLLWPVRLRGR